MSYYIVYLNAPMVKGTDWYLGIESGMYGFKPTSRQDEAHPFESKEAAEELLIKYPQFMICDDEHLPAKIKRGQMVLRFFSLP